MKRQAGLDRLDHLHGGKQLYVPVALFHAIGYGLEHLDGDSRVGYSQRLEVEPDAANASLAQGVKLAF